jgi:Flp pilus assembly protein TadD
MLYLNSEPKLHSTEMRRALNAADGYLYFNMFDEAWQELESIPTAEVNDSAVLLARIRVLLHKREWSAAETLSGNGARLHPEEAEFPVQRAFALHQLQKGDEAAQALREAPEWILRTGILHYNLACYEARLGDLATARQCIDKAIQMNSEIKKNARRDPDLQALWN